MSTEFVIYCVIAKMILIKTAKLPYSLSVQSSYCYNDVNFTDKAAPVIMLNHGALD